jgi:hypothetical protein
MEFVAVEPRNRAVRGEVLRLAGAVKAASEHPIAAAIASDALRELGRLPPVTHFSNRPGSGVVGRVEGHDVEVGRGDGARLGRSRLDRARGRACVPLLLQPHITAAASRKAPLCHDRPDRPCRRHRIAIMELIDNGFILLVPGALEAGLSDLRFWLPLLGGFVIAWPFAFAVNRAMIRRGRGHAAVHAYH